MNLRRTVTWLALLVQSAWQAGLEGCAIYIGGLCNTCHATSLWLSALYACRPVLTASEASDAWDCGSVGTPCAVSMAGGSWRLYYSGKQQTGPGAWTSIGMALNTEDSDQFEGIQIAFKRGRQA